MIPLGIVDHQKGTTWDGAEMIITESDSEGVMVPKDLTGVEIIAQFKNNRDVIFTYKTTDNSISVPNPTNGKLYFVGGIINHPANTYFFEVQFKLLNGDIEKTPVHSWTIYQ